MLWAARFLWVAMAALGGAALATALEDTAGSGPSVALVLWWVAVGAGVVALVVPSTIALTGLRMLAPALVVAVAAMVVGGAGTLLGGGALLAALAAAALVLSAEVGEACVQASAYGHEQRHPLRVPAAVLPAAVIVWAVWATAAVAGAVLLANARWWAGGVVATLAAGLTWVAARRLHVLSNRWLVLVPAGVVVHDSLVLGETLMVPKHTVVRAGLAYAGTGALDLTGPAGGHAIEVEVKEMAMAHLAATKAHPQGKAVHVQAFLVAPARPGRALQAMAANKVPVG